MIASIAALLQFSNGLLAEIEVIARGEQGP
jgi:hypothetical protein